MQGILAGRYRLERQLGKGGMGSVWLAEHLTLNSWVAVKLMDPAIAATTEGAERFRREAQAAASLRSAHVVQVLDYGVHENTPFLVMELLQGQSLAECLEREKRLTPERTLSIVSQVARAIGRAHAGGIVHRDLKPDNIFLVREDDQELAKVLDFGIAKTTGPRFGGMETRTGVTMGTPYYMSPEQVEGKKALDHRTDLWALAVITCECLTGIRPFDGQTFGELLLNICARPVLAPSAQGFNLPGFDQWFAKGTNRNPDLRFASAQELSAALADVVAGRVPATGGPGGTLALSPEEAAQIAPGLSATTTTTTTTGPTAIAATVNELPLSTLNPAPRRLLVPLLIGTVVLLAIAVLLLIKLSTSKAPDALQGDHASASATPSAAVAAAPGVAPAPAEPAGTVTTNANPAKAEPKAGHPAAVAAAPGSPTPPEPVKPAAPATNPTPVAASAPHSAAVERCFSDSFTGQIRPASAPHPSGTALFACHQNAFTGAYQR